MSGSPSTRTTSDPAFPDLRIGAPAAAPSPSGPRRFTIDAPVPADAEAIARVHVRGWEVAYGHALDGEEWFGEPALRRRLEQWTATLSAGPDTEGAPRVLVARDEDGVPVGFAASWPVRNPQPVREQELSTLYVEPGWHGTGLARELVEELLGGRPASLWVAEDNPRARRFYEKLGFAPDGTRQVDERWPQLPDIRMVR